MSVALLCRTCGKRIHRFSATDLFSDETTLKKIHALTGLWLTNEFNMPENICAYCLLDLEHAFDFRERCIKINEILVLQSSEETRVKSQSFSDLIDNELVDNKIDDSLESDSNVVTIDEEDDYGSENDCKYTNALPYIVVPASKNYSHKTNRRIRKNTPQPSNTAERLNQSQNFYCDACERFFNDEFKFNRHLQRHPDAIPEEYSFSDRTENTENCEDTIQGITCVSMQRASQSNKKRITSSSSGKSMKLKNYFCDQCGRTFNDKANLNRHLQRHKGVKKFECEQCGYKDYSQHLIKLHTRIKHMGEKPYACKYCDNRFANSMTRLRHQRSHVEYRDLGIKQPEFSCSLCNKSFGKKCSLERHAIVHTGEQPFGCEICNVFFNRKSSLHAHYRSKAHKNRDCINLD